GRARRSASHGARRRGGPRGPLAVRAERQGEVERRERSRRHVAGAGRQAGRAAARVARGRGGGGAVPLVWIVGDGGSPLPVVRGGPWPPPPRPPAGPPA